jgi:outer membrane beta-barrel protein
MSVFGALLLGASVALAQEAPQYSNDPFGDGDFNQAPLIVQEAHPTSGRLEFGAALASSFIDKYNSHLGLLLNARFHPLQSLGFGLEAGFLDGRLTPIVTGPSGIIGNKVDKCAKGDTVSCSQADPDVPDYDQITGVITGTVIWAPLYGKISLVSELDMNLQFYALAGGGVNGTRRVHVKMPNSPRSATDFTLTNGGLGQGGVLSNLKAHGTAGLGLRLFLSTRFDVRLEARDLFFLDNFDFNKDSVKESYRSDHFFVHLGAGFIL